MRQKTPHHTPQRHVTVDGIRYSIESGRKLTHRSLPRPTPSSPAVEKAEQNQTMHTHYVSHPAIPLPTHQERPERTASAVQIIIRSFRQKQDRRAFDVALVLAVTSPWLWFAAALPWAILSLTRSQHVTLQQAYSVIRGLLTAPYQRVILVCIAALIILFCIWLIRHILQLVSYATNIRRIDHRSVDTEEYGWQALAKSHRLLAMSFFELLATSAYLGTTGLLILRVFDLQSQSVAQFKSLIIYSILVVFVLVLAISVVHRTITRVMLAVTNQSTAFLIIKSIRLTVRAILRTILFGLFWLVSASLAAGLMLALIWSTASYGQFTIGHHSLARAGLILLSTLLMYVVTAGFVLWSQGYWALVYHHLAHTSYRDGVSQLIVTKPHNKPRRSAIIQLVSIILGLITSSIVALVLLKAPAQRFFTSMHQRLPENISEFVSRK